MEVSSEAIVEEIIDPLMASELAQSYGRIVLRRIAPNAFEIDFGDCDGVYTVTVQRRGDHTDGIPHC